MDGTDAQVGWSDGNLVLQTDETGGSKPTTLILKGNDAGGTNIAANTEIQLYDRETGGGQEGGYIGL